MPGPRRLQFYQADVFTDQPFGGNPVAVFPDADGLTDVELQQIAREMNLSETVFVFPPTDKAAVVKMRIFTPTLLAGSTSAYVALRYMVDDVAVNGNYLGVDSLVITAIPEPVSALLFGLGLAGLAGVQARRRLFA